MAKEREDIMFSRIIKKVSIVIICLSLVVIVAIVLIPKSHPTTAVTTDPKTAPVTTVAPTQTLAVTPAPTSDPAEKKWVTTSTWKGDTNNNPSPGDLKFTTTSPEWRIHWDVADGMQGMLLNINPKDASGNYLDNYLQKRDRPGWGDLQGNGKPGNYTVNVTSFGCAWTITVEEYK